MGKRLLSFFLLWFFYSGPVFAVTIVDVSEVLTVVKIEYLSNCEWIETVETRTTTTYRESYPATPGVAAFVPDLVGVTESDWSAYSTAPGSAAFELLSDSLHNTYAGFRSPCFPNLEDKETILPDYCFAPQLTVSPINGPDSSAGYLREWSDVQLSYSTNYINNCDDNCGSDSGGSSGGHTTVPEPGTLGLLGIGLVLIGRRIKKERRCKEKR